MFLQLKTVQCSRQRKKKERNSKKNKEMMATINAITLYFFCIFFFPRNKLKNLTFSNLNLKIIGYLQHFIITTEASVTKLKLFAAMFCTTQPIIS